MNRRPTRRELEVNLRTAKALGLTIPDSVVVRSVFVHARLRDDRSEPNKIEGFSGRSAEI
jgi:hypothetical protein